MMDDLRRLAGERGCSVAEYVRRAVAWDRMVWDHCGGRVLVRHANGTLVQIELDRPPNTDSSASGRPLGLSGGDEVHARWVDGSDEPVVVSIGGHELLVGDPEVLIAAAWTVAAVVRAWETTPETAAQADGPHAPTGGEVV